MQIWIKALLEYTSCLRARAFIVAESLNGLRVVFVNLDAGMASQLVTIEVLERLSERFGKLNNEDNLAINGTHTHAGPGGYLQYVLYSVTSLGFIPQSFDVIVTVIQMSIVQAHQCLKSSTIFINSGLKKQTKKVNVWAKVRLVRSVAAQTGIGDLVNAGVNRSPSAY
ncbi:neutral ceramidase-like protein [Tanacetum coccineum]